MRPVRQRCDSADGALSACLVSLLEVEWAESPAAEGAATLERWQEWLAARNLRVVAPAGTPGGGFWVAREAEDPEHYLVMFGTPPDVFWDPRPSGTAGRGELMPALVLCPLDPAMPSGSLPPASASEVGVVEGLFVAGAAGAPMSATDRVEAVGGRGLFGDRYFAGSGHFSAPGRTGQDLSLIEGEALDALLTEYGLGLDAGDARRNVVTRGIDLNALVGRRFSIGGVECFGQRWCEPCARLQQLTAPGVLRGLVHRGGLRADLLGSGTIRTGDPVCG